MADATGESNFFDSVLRSTQQTLLGFGSTIKSDVEVALLSYIRKLEILEANQERDKKAQLQRAEQLRQIRDDETKSIEERTTANNALATVINFREEQTIKFQQEKLAAYQSLLKMDKDNIEVQTAIKQIEFEIADAREEAQGFRSEQLANDLALSREFNANALQLAQLRIQGEIDATAEGTKERFNLQKQLIESTRQLQLQAAGENQQLRDIANQEAKNSIQELNEEIEKSEKAMLDFEKSIDDELLDEEKETDNAILELRKKLQEETEKTTQKLRDSEQKAADERLQIEKQLQQQLKNERIDIAAQSAQAVTDILFEASSQRRDEELERLSEQREEDLERVDAETEEDLAAEDAKVEAGILTEEEAETRKRQIQKASDAEKARIEQEADRREAAIKTKQARSEKIASLADVAINTAVSISKAFAQLGPIAAAPFIPFLVAQGAIQTAAILATPIPKFEKGTKGQYSTPNTWIGGEKGSEMVLSPSGEMFLTPDRPTLFQDMPNHMVIPHKETQQRLADMAVSGRSIGFNDGGIRSDLKAIKKAISSQSTTTEKDGVRYSRKNNRLKKDHQSFIAKMKY